VENDLKTTYMKKYVVAFMLTPDFKFVWLIKKNKPEWQKDCLNGIGGKIEAGETPIQAIIREIKEEAGLTFEPKQLTDIGRMIGTNNDGSEFQVHIFTGVTNQELITQEEEIIGLYKVTEVKNHKHIDNVPMLIETAIYRLTGSSYFYSITMEYDQKMREQV
jgi:8-oxo-dGTP diphosphatase